MEFSQQTCTTDWDFVLIDHNKINKAKAIELLELCVKHKTILPVVPAALVRWNQEKLCDEWEVVNQHTEAFVNVCLAKLWGTEKDETPAQYPASAGMIRLLCMNSHKKYGHFEDAEYNAAMLELLAAMQ